MTSLFSSPALRVPLACSFSAAAACDVMSSIMCSGGFEKARSDNLPRVDVSMIFSFFAEDERFNASEIRGSKSILASRESYGDQAIGYVQVKRTGDLCIVKAQICLEHKTRSKTYAVTITIDETQEKIGTAECHDCCASEGGCKHMVAMLMWLHRRSEDPSPTDIACYWVKPMLANVGKGIRFITTKDFGKKNDDRREIPQSNDFLEDFLTLSRKHNVLSQLSKHNYVCEIQKVEELSLHKAIMKFTKEGGGNAEMFLKFLSKQFSQDSLLEAVRRTAHQSESHLWHEFRYGRITASKLHEAANCSTFDGSLVKNLLGVSLFKGSKEMKRGLQLEKDVRRVVETELGVTIKGTGLYILQTCPIFGASPDGIADDFVLEIKCPSSEESKTRYIKGNRPAPKFEEQMMLQMLLTRKMKGVYCVADPKFEENRKIQIVWVSFNSKYLTPILKRALLFWKDNVFPRLIEVTK